MKAILIVSHGSRSKATKNEVETLIAQLKKKFSDFILEYAFLEIESPSIPAGIDQCIKAGADEIIITLNFLNSGRHVDNDIPEIVKNAKKVHPTIKFHITRPIGQHKDITYLFTDLINNASK